MSLERLEQERRQQPDVGRREANSAPTSPLASRPAWRQTPNQLYATAPVVDATSPRAASPSIVSPRLTEIWRSPLTVAQTPALQRLLPPPQAMVATPMLRARSQQRDSALALALEKSQGRCAALQLEMDQSQKRLAQQEAETIRLTMIAERSEAENRALVEEKQHLLSELSTLRREHRGALDQLADLKAEVLQSRADSEDLRGRWERMVAEQRTQIEALEDVSGRAARDLDSCHGRAEDFSEALFVLLRERTSLLHFLVDLLTALQALFYDPTPFASAARNDRGALPRAEKRARSSERPYVHTGPGGGALYRSFSPGPEQYARRTQCRAEWREGIGDIRDLVASLESEIGASSHEYSMLVQRVLEQAERSAKVLGPAFAGLAGPERQPKPGQGQEQEPASEVALGVCIAWAGEDRRRRGKLGRWQPAANWPAERETYKSVTRTMESKFAQLAKLQRVLHARQAVLRRRP